VPKHGVSAFFGVVIKTYWNEGDHPISHFPAEYGDHAAAISIDGEVLGGTFPPRPLRLVGEWAALHRDELLANWERARDHQLLEPIEPLS
jgi:hypothetical protein